MTYQLFGRYNFSNPNTSLTSTFQKNRRVALSFCYSKFSLLELISIFNFFLLWNAVKSVCIGSLQVFHSLLKAHTMEARAIVRQAMAILTPAVPARMEDGHQMLTHWTRKIIVEEGHTVPQLVHILHLIVQHFRVSKIT